MPLKRPEAVAAKLLDWYDAHRRALPWRAALGEASDPYSVWLSEVMLQQTTVATVRPRFAAWVARWPDVASLAAADEAEVMAAWAGLGYYARARNLARTARVVAAEHGGRFPDTEEALRRLPGLGAYTAAAVAAIAFGRRAVVVDANVERVVARLAAIDTPLPAGRAAIRAAAEAITPEARAGDFAQGMMDLGATICAPKRPRCLLCPLREECTAFASGTPEAFPVKAPKRARPVRYGTVFWLERAANDPFALSLSEGRSVAASEQERTVLRQAQHERIGEILLVRRPARGLLGGMRALPTGEWVDTPPGLAGAPAEAEWRLLGDTIEHGFTHFTLRLALAVATVGEHEPAAGEWWPVAGLAKAGLPTVFRKAAEATGRIG